MNLSTEHIAPFVPSLTFRLRALISSWGERRASLGAFGEAVAYQYLRGKGYRVVDRNWRARSGEIDLVMAWKRTLVFIEVKTRSVGTSDAFSPFEAVDGEKRQKLWKLSSVYLRNNLILCRREGIVRVDHDVITVVLREGLIPQFEIRHYEGIFRSGT